MVEDGIINHKYLKWLEANLVTDRKRAGKEAWQLFVFSCWYQVQIKGTDPFAGVA